MNKSLASGVCVYIYIFSFSDFPVQDDVKILFVHLMPALTAIHETYLRMSSLEITVSLTKVAELLQAKVFVESQLSIVENGIERLDMLCEAL